MRVGLATSCCKTGCSGCMNVAWGLLWGGSWSTKPCVFPCKVAAAGNERCLLCAAVAAVQRVVVHVCVILRTSRISGCRLQCNGCMILVMFCRHVRREMSVSRLMLESALLS